MTEAIGILHHLPLSSRNWGGIQVQFAHFLQATRHDPRFRNHLSLDHRALPAGFERMAEALSSAPYDYRSWHGVPLPKGLRVWQEARQARRWGVDAVLNTNLLGDMRAARVAERSRAAPVYWERGAAWFPRNKPLHSGFTSSYRLIMGNSHASRRMLQEVWNVEAPIEVCSPCVWNAEPAEAPRSLPTGRPLHLGFAARLRAFKGGVLALHALAELRRRGFDALLLVAGEGPDRSDMEATAKRLDLEAAVRFLGQVSDMKAFYRGIDVLIHPALREPFGNILPEAAFEAVPCVAANVDGLPEAMAHGVSGLSVVPDLPLGEYRDLGGNADDVYPLVYHPARDTIGPPDLVRPDALADAVMAICGSASDYERFSAGALATARERAMPARHLDRFHDLMRKAASR